MFFSDIYFWLTRDEKKFKTYDTKNDHKKKDRLIFTKPRVYGEFHNLKGDFVYVSVPHASHHNLEIMSVFKDMFPITRKEILFVVFVSMENSCFTHVSIT